MAKLMTDAGLIVITAFISPIRAERKMVRGMMAPGEFVEVFIDTPLSVAEERDVKGLYAEARSGQPEAAQRLCWFNDNSNSLYNRRSYSTIPTMQNR